MSSRAIANPLCVDRGSHALHELAQHGRTRGDGRRVMLGSDEDEFSGHVHIDLSGALQPPVEPLWRKLMLGAFARRVGRATDRAEGLLEIEHGFLRQAKHGFLDWARNTINFGRLHRLPLSGLQTIRAGRSSEQE